MGNYRPNQKKFPISTIIGFHSNIVIFMVTNKFLIKSLFSFWLFIFIIVILSCPCKYKWKEQILNPNYFLCLDRFRPLGSPGVPRYEYPSFGLVTDESLAAEIGLTIKHIFGIYILFCPSHQDEQNRRIRVIQIFLRSSHWMRI